MPTTTRRTRVRRALTFTIPLILVACLSAAGLSALSNRTLPTGPQTASQLSPLDQALLQESLHLKEQLGDSIWAGWGKADIPVLLFNDGYAFLTGFPDPPAGWEKNGVEPVTYYRLPLSEMDEQPQNFTERIGEQWVGSIATKGVAAGYLVDGLKGALPDPLQAIVPYKLVIRFMLPVEQYVASALHETFHAYQVQRAPERFEDALLAYRDDQRYWTADADMHDAWQAEMNLLVEAIQTSKAEETAGLVRQFLNRRQRRRADQQLAEALVSYEQRIEWLEGLAMYVEFTSWRKAGETPKYHPLPTLAGERDFNEYATFQKHWSRQLGEMKRQATNDEEIRFYFSGMAQALLLDRLMPGWKARILVDDPGLPVGPWLETLLEEAVY